MHFEYRSRIGLNLCKISQRPSDETEIDGLQHVVKENWMRLAGVRTPQDQQIRFLDLSIGRRTAARTEHRRQTDDARSVSGAVAGVDVV